MGNSSGVIEPKPVDDSKRKRQQRIESTPKHERKPSIEDIKKVEKPLIWPLPVKEKDKDFVVNTLPMNEHYTLSPDEFDYNEERLLRGIKATTISFRPTHKITVKTNEHDDSAIYKLAHSQVTMKSKTDLWTGISSSDDMQKLLASLNVSNIESSEILQQRLQGLSKEAERVIGFIIEDTTDEQNRLLEYAQGIQARQEELYREWLQKYLIELDQWRSHELQLLHEKIDVYKEQISAIAHRKLAFVNEQVKQAKSDIFREEFQRQSSKTDEIVADMEKLTRNNDTQHFGTETKTDIHLQIQGHGGRKITEEKSYPSNKPFKLKREYVDPKMFTDNE